MATKKAELEELVNLPVLETGALYGLISSTLIFDTYDKISITNYPRRNKTKDIYIYQCMIKPYIDYKLYVINRCSNFSILLNKKR